jgi:hypothetical protein
MHPSGSFTQTTWSHQRPSAQKNVRMFTHTAKAAASPDFRMLPILRLAPTRGGLTPMTASSVSDGGLEEGPNGEDSPHALANRGGLFRVNALVNKPCPVALLDLETHPATGNPFSLVSDSGHALAAVGSPLTPSPPSAQHPGADHSPQPNIFRDENSPPWCGSRGLFSCPAPRRARLDPNPRRRATSGRAGFGRKPPQRK